MQLCGKVFEVNRVSEQEVYLILLTYSHVFLKKIAGSTWFVGHLMDSGKISWYKRASNIIVVKTSLLARLVGLIYWNN